ncbi:casein kinase 2 regulatory subunit [Vanrija albida]|uniref:Casein kinase II subunit beta n=1 Tax=Vanrija albida TaxID=181172 RepID=A0ABR3QF30_9TREE
MQRVYVDMAGRELHPDELEQDEDELEFDSSSQGSSDETSTLTWITWFTSLPGHDYFCEVHEDFIEDDFNLTGLQSLVPFWKEALEMVLDVEPEEDSSKIPDVSIVESSAELLYGLVHQRFILTKPGLAMMVEKYEAGHFGACPRVFCHSTHVLPCGRSDMPGIDTVKLYCPNCGDIYTPPSSKYSQVDGAFFGTSFGPLFFQTYPELLSTPFAPSAATIASSSATPSQDRGGVSPSPSGYSADPLANPNPYGGQRPALGKLYVPRIYGFKVSERARSGPRMRWLRERPERYEELDEVDHRGRWKDGAAAQGGSGDAETAPTEARNGRLFDDEDDEDAEEEEEEEEDGAAAAAAAQPQAVGHGRR